MVGQSGGVALGCFVQIDEAKAVLLLHRFLALAVVYGHTLQVDRVHAFDADTPFLAAVQITAVVLLIGCGLLGSCWVGVAARGEVTLHVTLDVTAYF